VCDLNLDKNFIVWLEPTHSYVYLFCYVVDIDKYMCLLHQYIIEGAFYGGHHNSTTTFIYKHDHWYFIMPSNSIALTI
jgi:hypothetical protein